MLEFYRSRHDLDLPTDHALLQHVCEKLLDSSRAFDAVLVISKIYKDNMVWSLANPTGHWKRGEGTKEVDGITPFQIEFFELWMRLAWATRSLVQWKYVAQEVLRLSNPMERSQNAEEGEIQKPAGGLGITSSFVYLTRVVAAKVLKDRWSRVKAHAKKQRGPIEEVVWLVKKVEKRREQQIGRREYWKTFDPKQSHF
jgi:hypothetical protein